MLAIPLLLIVAVVVWVVSTRRSGSLVPAGGVHVLRHVLQYSLLFAALCVAAIGVTRLLSVALPPSGFAERSEVDLALGLSLTLVAVPAWVLLWRLVAKRLEGDTAERKSAAWALYLDVAVTTALVTGFVNLVQVGRILANLDPYEPEPVAAAAVWAAVWAGHTWLLEHPHWSPAHEVSQLAVLTGSITGLVAFAFAAGTLVSFALGELYEAIAPSAVLAQATSTTLREGLIVVVLAAPVWWWHWWHQAAAGPRTLAWHAYVMLVAILGGLLTAAAATGVLLHALLQWFLGDPESAEAAIHFESVPAALAALLIGWMVWWLHRRHIGDSATRTRTEPERAYEYLVAGVGLVAAASGLAVAVMALLQAFAPEPFAAAQISGSNTAVLAATLLAVGAPLWAMFWRPLQRRTAAHPEDEIRAPSRRVYLFLLFAATGVAALVSLAVLLYVVLRDMLQGDLALAVLVDIRIPLGVVVAAGAVSAYHWRVQRAQQSVVLPAQPLRPHDIVLVSPDGAELAAAVAAGTGAKVRRLHRLDAPGSVVDVERVTAAVLAAPSEHVLVTVEPDGDVRVIPYDVD